VCNKSAAGYFCLEAAHVPPLSEDPYIVRRERRGVPNWGVVLTWPRTPTSYTPQIVGRGKAKSPSSDSFDLSGRQTPVAALIVPPRATALGLPSGAST
jgi:hypothetical protein